MNKPKDKKCKYCGDIFTPRTSLQKNCFKSECIKAFYEENKPKIERTTIKRNKERKKDLKESLVTISQLKQQARRPFQKFIRIRDENKPCISCGSITATNWHAGHFKKAEIYFGLIFDENNVHKQCAKCNVFLGGNEANYRSGLVERYGEVFVSNLEEKALKTKDYMHTREELKEIKEKYLKRIKDLQNGI